MVRQSIVPSVLGLTAFLASAPASAVPISVTGGFTGFSSTVFGFDQPLVNGSVLCPDAGCQVSFGVANVAFGGPIQSVVFENSANELNSIGFTPAATQEVNGTGPSNPFLLGTLTYTNGTWSGDATVGFELTTHSLSPGFDGQTMTDTLQLLLTPNDFVNGTPEETPTSSISPGIRRSAARAPSSSRTVRRARTCFRSMCSGTSTHCI